MSLEHPTFTFVPDFTTPPRFGIATNHDRTASGQARQTVMFPQTRPDFIFAHRFAIETALEIQQLKEFFRARGGRTHPFFLPSWRRDLTLAAETVAEGVKQIPITSEDYEATHLTDTDPDHHGRYVFMWKDGEEVWTERIIRVLPGDAPGEEILDLDTAPPFEVDSQTWIGWAYLARFAEDRIEWQHWSTSAAEAEISFRAVRHANQNDLSVELEQIDQYGQLGFISAEAGPGAILPVTTRVAYAYGPETLHASQDAPYSMPWAVWPEADGIRIRKAVPPANEFIWIPNTGGTLSILFEDPIETDHIAMAFDQNAYEVIAFQQNETTIECRRFFNLAVETVEWEGQDPILQFNGLLDADLPTGDTDVVCYYIKPGINALWMRFQRDNFETEYLATLLPGRPIALKRAYFEYNVDASAGTLKVEFVDAGYRVCTLSSAAYPDPPPPPVPPYVEVSEADDATATASIVSGDYAYAVRWADGGGEFDPHPAFEDGGEATASMTGAYTAAVLYADGNDTDLGPHPAFEDAGEATATISGSYLASVIDHEETLADSGEVASLTISGTYALTVIFPPVTDEKAQNSAAITGVYEPA